MKACRICAGKLTPFFDMGPMPLANGLLDSPNQPEERYPITLCLCGTCGLVQLGHVVPAEVLYKDYPFQTGSSRRMVEHFAQLMHDGVRDYVGQQGWVVEIGCNDGSALGTIPGVKRIGVDPMPGRTGLITYAECFTEGTGQRIAREHAKANLVVACNVLGHVDDLHDFMRGVKILLAQDGAFVFEVPYFANTLRRCDWPQIYHEHLSYFSLQPLNLLLDQHEMHIAKIEHFDVHGGSIRITAKHGRERVPAVVDEVALELCTEVFSLHALKTFADRARQSMAAINAKVSKLLLEGKTAVGYCASAKGSVILNCCGISDGVIATVIDSTPAKGWRYMPGTHQFISHHIDTLNDWDAILLLSPNHEAEIRAKHPEFTGEWINPLPDRSLPKAGPVGTADCQHQLANIAL